MTMIKILQGSAVTQTVLGGLTIYLLVANFLWCICAKNYGNWLAVDKVIVKIIWLTFFGPPCKPRPIPYTISGNREGPIAADGRQPCTPKRQGKGTAGVSEIEQDSWAIAKKTARCAQYMGALKSFESPHYAPGYFSEICNGLLFRSILRMCVQNLKFVALPVREIIGSTQKIWAVPVYAHAPFSPKFLIGFCSHGPCEYAKFKVRSFTRSWDNRGYSKKFGQSLDMPTLPFLQTFSRVVFGWTLWLYRPKERLHWVQVWCTVTVWSICLLRVQWMSLVPSWRVPKDRLV